MPYVWNLARNNDDGCKDHERDNRSIVQCAIKSASFFSVTRLFRAGGISCKHIARRHKVCDHGTVRAEKEDGVEGDEARREDTGDDRLPGHTDIRAVRGEEEVEGRNEGGRESTASNVFFLQNTSKDDCEWSYADASKLVGRKWCISDEC